MARLVSLAQLCEEGHGTSPSALFMQAVDAGWPMGFDGSGLVGLREREADGLRQRKREREAAAAAEAERQRIEAQDAAVADLVRAAEQEETRARIRRLEAKVGPVWAIAAEMTRVEGLRPGYRSLDEHSEISRRVPTIDEIEQFAAREYGLDVSA
jgi:hypothetical protein